MDCNEDARGNDDDEALLAYFLPSVKDRERPDSRAEDTERAVPSPPESSALPVAYQETEHFAFDPFEYPENEVTRSKMISDALQQEDEFLEYLMSLPISHKFPEVVDDKHEHCDLRSDNSGIGESDDPTPHAMPPVSKVGLDHLDNLCKLMEQLGELRDQNSKLQRRVQYLEDLKSLHDMHKQLQESLDSKRKQDRRTKGEVEVVQPEERFSLLAERKFTQESVEDDESRLAVKQHASEESVLHGISPLSGYALECEGSVNSKNASKRKSHQGSRHSFRRQQYRERSRSVGHDEVGDSVREAIKNPRKSVHLQWQRQRRGYVKSKVSKWTKVKEAFRWEKAQLDGCSQRTEASDFPPGLPESKSQDSGIGLGQRQVSEDRPHSDEGNNHSQCFLRVKEVEPSASPSDSVLGGSSSPYHAYSYALSSSSSSSDDLMEIDLNLSSISEAIDIGPQRSASATDSTAEKLVQNEVCSEERSRRSLSQGQEEDAARRSKSLDCEDIQRPYTTFVLDEKGGSISKKAHRTPWGKVKDIIQTRRDSVKKKQKEEGRRDEWILRTDVEHTTVVIDQEEEGDRSGCESLEDSGADGMRWHQKVEDGRAERKGFRTTSPGSSPRRLTPTLTVTLPSTEELSGGAKCLVGAVEGQRTRLGDGRDDRCRRYSDCEEPDGVHHRKDGQISQLRETSLDTAGTSPPAPRRPSKWTKVKKAFLTAKKEVDGTARLTAAAGTDHPIVNSRIPCSECSSRRLSHRSPVIEGLQIYSEGCGSSGVNHDEDDILSGRGRRETLSEAVPFITAPPSPAADSSSPRSSSQTTQRDIQKNYDELQQKLSQEFHKKLSEWERMKGGWCTGSEGREENEDLKKKPPFDWEKNKEKASGRSTAPDESHLPTDFRKRLLEWKRVRASEARPEAIGGRGRGVPGGRGSVIADDESLPPQFRKRLVEWQLWRAVAGKSDQNVEELHKILPEEFYRKLQEWERIKSEAVVPMTMGGGRQFSRREPGAGGLVIRKDASALGRVVRRMRANEVALGEKWSRQRSEVAREVKHRGKEVQWLEKELQKVEREKHRLEREREKYLEREARLERMRKAMGQRPPGEQEVLIQTSTGFFRFQGISEKFTRKLYEWEKQRGIGPEASTFTLLDPTYRPTVASAASADVGEDAALDALRSSTCSPGAPSPALPRSRSEGSLAENGGPVHSQSSSLGQIEGKERSRSLEQEVPSRASSEPRMRSETRAILVSEETEEEDDDEEETAALLVEVEDVEVETAAALEELPTLPSETPIYSYAPEEVTRLIDSSGSESEKDCKFCSDASVNRSSSIRTQSSYDLIEENMTLINKLKVKENICRELENEIEDLEGKIQDIAKTYHEELERLRKEETGIQEKTKEQSSVTKEANSSSGSIHGSSHGEMVAQLKQRVDELERCKEQLKQEEENLQTSFQVHSEQQEALAQNLVGKMKLLQEVSKVVGGQEVESIEEEAGDGGDRSCAFKRLDYDLNDSYSMAVVQHLSSELLQLAEKLELTLADRNQEIRNLRFELQDRKKSGHGDYPENKSAIFRSGQTRNWSSAEGVHLSPEDNLVPLSDSKMTKYPKTMIPRQSSEELTELPFLLTSKVLQLKKELGNLCNSKEPKTSYQRCQPCRGKLQRIPHFQADEEEYESEAKGTPPEKDNYSIWRSKHKLDDRISYRPPPRPTADEAKEWAARHPNSSGCSSSLEGKGVTEAASSVGEEGAVGGKLQLTESERGAAGAERSRFVCSSPGLDVRKVETRRWKGEEIVMEYTSDAQLHGTAEPRPESPKSGMKKETEEGTKENSEDGRTEKDKENILKARRISDTHIAYESMRDPKISRRLTRDLPPNATHPTKNFVGHEKSKEGGIIVKGKGEATESRRPVEGTHNTTKTVFECSAPNVFVQTTRKIFSPICASSKGNDSSNVIGYVEEYLEDAGAAHVTKAPSWRRRNGGLPPTERVTPRPHQPPAELPKGGGEIPGRTSHRSESSSTCTHPLPPPSPLSVRRDKAKEAAPSIRIMIAKYDLKQQQQQEGGGDGRSPESRCSGGRSPAWLSPAPERRDILGIGGVRMQMEKYQEEVRKALIGYSNSEATTVQKSASAGIIRSGPCLKPPLHSIAKSSSAGAIKSGIEEMNLPQVEQSNLSQTSSSQKEYYHGEDGSIQMNESIEKALKMLRERHPSPPTSPSRSHKFAHVRAMRLKKAKEEFMKGSNVGSTTKDEDEDVRPRFLLIAKQEAENWPEEGSDPTNVIGENEQTKDAAEMKDMGDMNVVAERIEVKMRGGEGGGMSMRAVPKGSGATSRPEGATGGGTDAHSRHSQISFGSESSYEESVACQEGLIKSASSGMIDLYSQKCKPHAPVAKVSEGEGGIETSMSSSKCLANAAEGQETSKLGILSRFRRVKLRTKKMSAISALCRQSLLVNVEKEGAEGEVEECKGVGKRLGIVEGGKQKSKSTSNYSVPLCRSCPSSPVPSSKKSENSGSWIHNPKHVFKTQRDREEVFSKSSVGVLFPSKR